MEYEVHCWREPTVAGGGKSEHHLVDDPLPPQLGTQHGPVETGPARRQETGLPLSIAASWPRTLLWAADPSPVERGDSLRSF